MSQLREIKFVRESVPTVEGAGVRLRRAFGNADARDLDPFLLLDHFRSRDPAEYVAGFPWHPHRGIETITYLLEGEIRHEDSIGNEGRLGAGDLQWMTAGSGILHQEMPLVHPRGVLEGFQLWANLPGSQKMTNPRYQDVTTDSVPVVENDGVRVRVLAGQAYEAEGPIKDVVIHPEYLDVAISPHSEFHHGTRRECTVVAYVFEGEADFTGRDVTSSSLTSFTDGQLVVFEKGDEIRVRTGNTPVHFIAFSGIPLGEPIAWAGPIVMNSKAELEKAFDELENGTFIKTH